jgi:hypothetical protein
MPNVSSCAGVLLPRRCCCGGGIDLRGGDGDGDDVRYKINGHAAFWVSLGLLGLGQALGVLQLQAAYDLCPQIAAVAIAFSALLSVHLCVGVEETSPGGCTCVRARVRVCVGVCARVCACVRVLGRLCVVCCETGKRCCCRLWVAVLAVNHHDGADTQTYVAVEG